MSAQHRPPICGRSRDGNCGLQHAFSVASVSSGSGVYNACNFGSIVRERPFLLGEQAVRARRPSSPAPSRSMRLDGVCLRDPLMCNETGYSHQVPCQNCGSWQAPLAVGSAASHDGGTVAFGPNQKTLPITMPFFSHYLRSLPRDRRYCAKPSLLPETSIELSLGLVGRRIQGELLKLH
jgi:hypothetical protein